MVCNFTKYNLFHSYFSGYLIRFKFFTILLDHRNSYFEEQGQKENTPVSGNVGYNKNLHSGRCKFYFFNQFNHNHSKRKDSLETRAELAVLRAYVENQAILEPILLYPASKWKQTKEQGREDYLWTHIFTFL